MRISHIIIISIIHMRGAATPTTTTAEMKTTLFTFSSSSTNKASSSRRFRQSRGGGAFAFAAGENRITSSSRNKKGNFCDDARGSIARSEYYSDRVLLSSSSKGVKVRTKAKYSNNDDDAMKKDTKFIDYGRVGVAFAFPALAGFLFGLDIGVSSGALESIKTSSTDFFALTASQSGQIEEIRRGCFYALQRARRYANIETKKEPG